MKRKEIQVKNRKKFAGLLCCGLLFAIMGGSVSAEETKTLRVAMECNHYPYNWVQTTEENGAVPIEDSTDYAFGYDVMLAKRICQELGWELEIWKFDWDALVPLVVSGTVDCVISGQQMMPGELEEVDFTEPYSEGAPAVLIRSDGNYAGAMRLIDLAGAACTAQKNTVWYDNCLPQIPEAEIADAKNSAADILSALKKEKCDAVVTDLSTAKAALVLYSDFALVDFSDSPEGFDLSEEDAALRISVAKDNQELKEAVNEVLSGISQQEREEMMQEALNLLSLPEE